MLVPVLLSVYTELLGRANQWVSVAIGIERLVGKKACSFSTMAFLYHVSSVNTYLKGLSIGSVKLSKHSEKNI